MRIALVHDWLATYTGSERVFEQMALEFADADLFTLVDALPAEYRSFLTGRSLTTSFLQRLPGISRFYRSMLPLMPVAVERFDFSGYDVVLTSSHAVVKGALTYPGQIHVCYLQQRNLKYAYDDRALYRGGAIKRLVEDTLLTPLRTWDAIASRRPDLTIANSAYVASWHRKVHGVDAEVLHPPIDLAHFSTTTRAPGAGYLCVARLEPYKRIDLAIRACNELQVPLTIVGSGSQERELRALAGPTVRFLGFQGKEAIAELLAQTKALLFPGREDFGLTPVEAQACGAPVIAFARGGALETVAGLDAPRPTGVFFEEPTVASLIDAMATLERHADDFDPTAARANAARFSPQAFRRALRGRIERAWKEQHA